MAAIRKLRTWMTVRCLACKHWARIGVPLNRQKRYDDDGFVLPPKFRCSNCGSSATSVERPTMDAWARQRRASR